MNTGMDRAFYRGEVYQVTSGGTIGAEITGSRPGVIVSSDRENKTSPLVTVVYLTTQQKRYFPTNVPLSSMVGDTAICNQIYTVDKQRLGVRKQVLSVGDMEKIDEAIKLALGFDRQETVVVEKDDVSARVEVELWKRLYEKAMDQLVQLKFENDLARRPVPVVEKKNGARSRF